MNPTPPFILTLQPSKEEVFECTKRVTKHFCRIKAKPSGGLSGRTAFMGQDYTPDSHSARSSTEFWVQEHVMQCHTLPKGKATCVNPH